MKKNKISYYCTLGLLIDSLMILWFIHEGNNITGLAAIYWLLNAIRLGNELNI